MQKFPYKGTDLTRFSRNDIEEFYNLRIELEPFAVAWGQVKAGPFEIDALSAMAGNISGMRLM